LTNILFIVLANAGKDIGLLYWVIAADNLSAGLASAAFVAFLSSLTHISFTAMQYAIFSSIMTLFPKVLGGYSGSIVESIGYESFFLITALMGLPVLFLIVWVNRLLAEK
jgi:PAT family beta-lactamase induction signal transducer AmpG